MEVVRWFQTNKPASPRTIRVVGAEWDGHPGGVKGTRRRESVEMDRDWNQFNINHR